MPGADLRFGLIVRKLLVAVARVSLVEITTIAIDFACHAGYAIMTSHRYDGA